MRRPSGLVVIALALLGGILVAAAWLHRHRRAAAPMGEEVSAGSAPTLPAASSSAAPARTARQPRAAATSAAEPATDEQLLVAIRAEVRSNPGGAEALAREARTRFPHSPRADEWDALLVDALVNQQRIGPARSETYYYYDHHPRGSFTAHLFALTGVHPMPTGPGPH